MKIHDLPDDILIPIISFCDIDTLFSLRLTAKPLRTVIDSYIRTIAPVTARTTFPKSELLLQPPKNGYSLRWLRNLIPRHLAAIALDKDKLRPPYLHSGFPYGIPSTSNHPIACHWRRRVANGWRVLRCFYLISSDVYAKGPDDRELGGRRLARRVSGSVRSSRLWMAVSCPYQACSEHGVKRVFSVDGKERPHDGDFIERVRRRESLILKKRLAYLKTLKDRDLLDYIYLWRILLWVFRGYRRPGTSVECIKGVDMQVSRPNWMGEIGSVNQGCSWLIWFVLHVGSAPFWSQWWMSPSNPNLVRDLAWQKHEERSLHQIELEREFISKFEFAVRRRCLTPERGKRLNEEIWRGATIKTISMDCIPWDYDQNPIINRPARDFPWYKSGEYVWMDGDVWMRVGRGFGDIVNRKRDKPGVGGGDWGGDNGQFYGDGDDNGWSGSEEEEVKDPLEQVPYLVYLGFEDPGFMERMNHPGHVWF